MPLAIRAVSEPDLSRHLLAVLVAKVAIDFHGRRPTVLVAEPTRDGGDVHAGLDAPGREQVPEVMVRDPCDAHLRAGAGQGAPAFLHEQHPVGRSPVGGGGFQGSQQPFHVGENGEPAHFAVLRAIGRITSNDDLAAVPVNVRPGHPRGLAECPEAGVGKELDQLGDAGSPAPAARPDFLDQRLELVRFRQDEVLFCFTRTLGISTAGFSNGFKPSALCSRTATSRIWRSVPRVWLSRVSLQALLE